MTPVPTTSIKRYACIGYFNKAAMDRLSTAELQVLLDKCRPHMATLYASGSVVLDLGLSSQTWSMQRRSHDRSTVELSYPEAQECIGSIFLIEARDDDEALRVAQMHPTTQLLEGERLGWRLEVRPVHYYNPGTEP